MSPLLQVRSQRWLSVGGVGVGVGVGALRPPFRLVSCRTGGKDGQRQMPPDTFKLGWTGARTPKKIQRPAGSCYDAVEFARWVTSSQGGGERG
ncbi:hypothetical protein HBH64_041860 [Parastagonospora nodorum]|nr:hypothetical protein HBH46_208690 [Parastagonospora nodorum]KAH4295050.1 hypothetical protein HBI02_174970 [Parastagonospora nodorum]KAH4301029.1 hypothetical protein HBI01_107230 [Parastagonospora nodorum]KAH4321188.1 hypothetical protein HBI00_216080 [Parastagonospora nodorum]KAH4360880.1 hypothetical protein HBH94_191350 [Parastagonospora nodorum]